MHSTPSARKLAARWLPASLKRALKEGPPGALVRFARQKRNQMVTRSLRPDRIFEQPLEHRLAGRAMSVIVPIHDAPAVTRSCLASLECYGTKAEVILVDDGSKLAETVETIREFSGRCGWKVVSNSQPSGHSLASAAGARLATKPYLCLLNSDTVVTPWCWLPVQQAFHQDSTIGVVGPSTSRSGTQQALPVARDCRFDWNENQICGFAERLLRAHLLRPLVDLPWIGGFALFIRRSLWHKLGGFDHDLADYGNEVELCKRVTKACYRAVWARRAYIHHYAAQSYTQVMPLHEIEQKRVTGAQFARDKHKALPAAR
jgi:GT2 family glycosyltransferase